MNPQSQENDAANRASSAVGEQRNNDHTPLSQRFIAHFYRANRALHETMGARLQADHGLEMREFMVLTSICNGYHYSGSLARRLYVNKYAVSRVVQKLLDAGLIRRAIDEDDSRKVRLDTTEQGEELRQQALASMNDSVRPLLTELGDDASEQLILGLEQMIVHMQETPSAALVDAVPGDEA